MTFIKSLHPTFLATVLQMYWNVDTLISQQLDFIFLKANSPTIEFPPPTDPSIDRKDGPYRSDVFWLRAIRINLPYSKVCQRKYGLWNGEQAYNHNTTEAGLPSLKFF